MRTIAQKAAFHIAVEHRSKEAEGNVSIYVILMKEEVPATKHTFFRKLVEEEPESSRRILVFF